MPRDRIVLAVSPQELDAGTPPDPDVNGYRGGVKFDRGVSEPVSYDTARRFAARGNCCLPPEEAREKVQAVREAAGSDDASSGGESHADGSASKPSNEEEGGDSGSEGKTEGEESEAEGEKSDAEDVASGEEAKTEKRSNPLQHLTPAALESRSLPEEYEGDTLPGYQDMLSDLSDAGLSPRDFFGGQPKKGPLTKLYVAYVDGIDALNS